MIFKVWPKDIPRPEGERIEEASNADLVEAIEKTFNHALKNHAVDIHRNDDMYEEALDKDKINRAYGKIVDWWEDNHFLNVGDYTLQKRDSIDDVQIPDKGIYDTDIIFFADDYVAGHKNWYAVMQDKEDRDLSYGSFCKRDAFIECKEMNDRYEEEGGPREAFVAEIQNPTEKDSVLIHEYKDNEVLYYLNSWKEMEAAKSDLPDKAAKEQQKSKQIKKENEAEI